MIHLAVPLGIAAALAGVGVFGLLGRRHVVMVLIGAELLLNAAGVLLITAATLPRGGLSGLREGGSTTAQTDPGLAGSGPGIGDPLVSGQVLTIFVIAIAAAEIGVALAIVLLLFRRRGSSDLAATRELGEYSGVSS